MVVTETEFLLVDPDKSRLGWGIVHFIAFLQVGRQACYPMVITLHDGGTP